MAKQITYKTGKGIDVLPFLKTIEQMSKLSGIGENRLRQLVENGEIDYIQNGNRRLLTDEAIWDWYQRNKRSAVCGK